MAYRIEVCPSNGSRLGGEIYVDRYFGGDGSSFTDSHEVACETYEDEDNLLDVLLGIFGRLKSPNFTVAWDDTMTVAWLIPAPHTREVM